MVYLRHQLNVHLDYGPGTAELGSLDVRYGYPHSGEHQLRDQVLVIPHSDIPQDLRRDLDAIYAALARQMSASKPVRLPHAEIVPTLRPTLLTLVVQDQSRAPQLPIARLNYHEEVAELRSRFDREVRLEGPNWSPGDLVVAQRVRAAVRKLAWQDYRRLVGHHLFDA